MLSDQELIDELRREFTAAITGLQPRAETLEQVHRELADLTAERPSGARRLRGGQRSRFSRPRWWPSAGLLSSAGAAAVAIAVVVTATLSLHGATHHGHLRGTAEPPALAIGRSRIVARAADPAGQAGWALRETRTGPRSGCLRLGRAGGSRFLALSDRQDAAHCAQTDATGHLYLDLQLPDDMLAGTGWRSLYYGVLGPDAISVTYRSTSGTPTTIPTGPDGGYLIVERATCPPNDVEGDSCEIGGSQRSRQLAGGAITKVTYRNGSTCQLTYVTPGQGTAERCRNVGFASAPPRRIPHVAPARARAQVRVNAIVASRICYRVPARTSALDRACDHGTPHGFRLQIGNPGQPVLLISLRFTAPLAADNHHSVYEWSLGRVSGPHCIVGGGVSATTKTPISKGQHVLLQDQENPCPGIYAGLITWTPNGHPGDDRVMWDEPIRDRSLLVGRFRFTVH